MQILPAAVALCLLPACAAERVTTPESARRIASELLDPSRRDAAACALLRWGRYARLKPPYKEKVPAAGCRVRAVVRGHPTDPEALLAVFLSSLADHHQGPPGSAWGHLVLFDSRGRIVPVFSAANYLGPSDAVFAYRNDGARAVAHCIPYGPQRAWKAQILHIVPLEAGQQPILNVVLGPPVHEFDEFTWTWRLHGAAIEIGPKTADGGIEVRATYRLSESQRSYEGPPGALDGDFYRFEFVETSKCCSAYPVAEAFARAKRGR